MVLCLFEVLGSDDLVGWVFEVCRSLEIVSR